MNSAIVAGLLLAFVVVSVVRRRRERIEWSRLADAQRVGFGQVIDELTSLRAALIAVGAAERLPQLPPDPAPPLPSVKRGDDATPASREADDGPTLAEVDAALRRAFHVEADERDARHAAREAAREAQPPPPPSGNAAVAARFQGPAPGEDDATVQRALALPRASPAGLAGAPLERPVSDPKRAAREHAARRDTLTPTEPSAPSLDARIQRRWTELVAAAQGAGDEAAHCHGPVCMSEGGGIDCCVCGCDGCVLVLGLLVRAEREIRGGE